MVKNPHAPLPGKEVDKIPHQKSAQDNYLDTRGREMPSPVPIAPPIGYKKTPSLSDQIRAIVISEKLKHEALSAGYETFEEADDFEDPDDDNPSSAFEMEEDFEGDSPTNKGEVEAWIKARALEMGFTAPSENLGQRGIPPGADPLQAPQGGVGEDLGIPPGETPPSHRQAPAQPNKGSLTSFLRRG